MAKIGSTQTFGGSQSEPGTGGSDGSWRGYWTNNTLYVLGDQVWSGTSGVWQCQLAHLSTEEDEPETGRDHLTYWMRGPGTVTTDQQAALNANSSLGTANAVASMSDLSGPFSPASHASSHITGTDLIDGDQLVMDYEPVNYTPTVVEEITFSVDHLTSHLKGIDAAIGAIYDLLP